MWKSSFEELPSQQGAIVFITDGIFLAKAVWWGNAFTQVTMIYGAELSSYDKWMYAKDLINEV